jgi:hypothetical protein
VRIDAEVLMPPASLVLYADSIRRWDGPSGGAPIDRATRRQIIANIRDAFLSQGHEIQVQDSSELLDFPADAIDRLKSES